MQHAPTALVADEQVRAAIAALVARDGVAPVARLLGVSRPGLTSYLAGRGHRGTVVLVEHMYARRIAPEAAR